MLCLAKGIHRLDRFWSVAERLGSPHEAIDLGLEVSERVQHDLQLPDISTDELLHCSEAQRL